MTEAPRTPKVPRSSKGQQRIYPRVVYARVTELEWSTIQQRARQSGLSMSRYLIETGLRKKAPLTLAERARLQFLLHLFRRTLLNIKQIACDNLVLIVGGSETRQLLGETESFLEQISQELSQRIRDAASWEKKPDSDGEPKS